MRYTLVADGTSDKVLLPILTWSLKRNRVPEVEAEWADFTRLPPRRDLTERLRTALDLYPCDILFIHRDSENPDPEPRRVEILEAANGLTGSSVPVIPVRMTEAWLLFSERAIRGAAGNPNGREPLDLPDMRQVEALPDPKARLYDLLKAASGLSRRRLTQFRPKDQIHQIPNYIDDYSPLDALPAFSTLQRDIRRCLGAE